jgi:formamidopyrimidine-DNA glycosylase
MPELPEVETVRIGLAPVMEGVKVARLVQRRPDLRFPFPENFATRLEGRTVLRLGRRAKFCWPKSTVARRLSCTSA